ncbi:unnamed protein product [Dicrocoelium dendriticum]|nr:unnamed protein product [Dicrocoelium dendriticum]
MAPFSGILLLVVYLLPTAFTFTTSNHKLPPLPLKPLKSTADIRYSHFDVPPDSLSFRFSTYLTFQSSCEPANLTLFLRPHSLPVVAPDPVAVPPGVLILPDAYMVNVDVHTARPIASNVHIDTESLYDITYSRKDQSVSVDVKLYCPAAGMWFLGVFFLDRASEPKCSSWMFPAVSFNVVTNIDAIVLLSPTVTKPDADYQRPLTVPKGIPAHDSVRSSVPVFRSLVSAPPKSSLLHNKSDFYAQSATDKRADLFNTSIFSPEDSSSTVADEPLVKEFNDEARISILLEPSEGRLFRILLLPGTTDVDFIIDECIFFPPTAPRPQHIHPTLSTATTDQTEEAPICPILVDAGRGVLPKGFGSEARLSEGTNNTLKNTTHSALPLPNLRLGKTYRLDSLHDSSTVHYVYLRNLNHNQLMTLQVSFSPIFGCPLSSPPEGTSSFEYPPHYKNRQVSGDDESLRASGAPTGENASSESVTSITSLLPWLDPSWSNLTLSKARSFADNHSVPDVFVDLSEPHSHALDRCFTLSSPTRVSGPQAFVYHFIYQPELNQSRNVLHISPWQVMVIPIQLDSKLDTGGSLEISLQLDALDPTVGPNGTNSKIYHLCDADAAKPPFRLKTPETGEDTLSTDRYSLSNISGCHSEAVERPTTFTSQSTSPACLLPINVLSLCDFFGGFFSLWVTIIAACAMPAQHAQLAYVLFVLVLTVTLQVARHSVAQFVTPCALGVTLLVISWIVRSRQTGHLFPPIQWWILSFSPALLCALFAVALFTSPMLKRDYTRSHSLWHILLGCSLIGMLPWPDRWRVALIPAVPRYLPLSCGGTVKLQFDRKNSVSIAASQTETVSQLEGCFDVFANGPVLSPTNCDSSAPQIPDENIRECTLKSAHFMQKFVTTCKPTTACLRHACLRCWWKYRLVCVKWDTALELKPLLDQLVRRWPKLTWLLPYGYTHEPSKHDSECAVFCVTGIQQTLESKEQISVPNLNHIRCPGKTSPTAQTL